MDRYFVCLANSYKRGGRCIAGVELVTDSECDWTPARNEDGTPHWIRPIARTTYGEIPNSEAAGIGYLSLVRLTEVVPCPAGFHVEDVGYSRMEKCDYEIALESAVLSRFLDTVHQPVFFNRGRAVPVDAEEAMPYSLMLIRPECATAYIDESREKSRNRMNFVYGGVEYDFPITDPVFIERQTRDPKSFLDIKEVYLTLSLGLDFEGWCHKLVAAVGIPEVAEASRGGSPEWFDQYEQELERLLAKKDEIEEEIADLRSRLLQQMEAIGVEKVQTERFTVSYTPAKTVMQFDSKAFRADNDELYARYCRPRQREASLVVRKKQS